MTDKSAKDSSTLSRFFQEGDEVPRKRRKAARPAEIVEAGFAEFAERGFAAARMEDVARRAGVVKGTLYRYFSDKEALFFAALKSRALPVLDEIEKQVEAFDGSTRDLLTLMLRAVYERLVATDLKVLLRIIIAEGGNFPPLAEHYHREMISKGERVLRGVLERGVARGEVRPGPIVDLPVVVMGPAVMAAVWKITFDKQQPIDPEQFLRAHLALLDGGLLRKDRRSE